MTTLKETVERQAKEQEAIDRLIKVDSEHEMRLLKASFLGAQELLLNGSFIDIMRLIFEMTGYDVNPAMQISDKEEFARLQGRKEVWCEIRERIIGNNPKALTLIEHHKQINRQNNNV